MGWQSLERLTDEQDGPAYWTTWEPRYPNKVVVEITLAQPVLATEIRVAQDPINHIFGNIEVVAGTTEIVLPLWGTGGWSSHEFPTPKLIESFTIARDQESENIVELLLCVEP